MTDRRHLEAVRQVARAVNRQRELARWLETFERLQAVRPHDDDERLAQYQALQLLEQARP